MPVKATLKQLNDSFPDLERIAKASVEDGKVRYGVGQTKRDAKEALEGLEEEFNELLDDFKEAVRDSDGKVTGYRIPPGRVREHERIQREILQIEVELYGQSFTQEEAETHFKPSAQEYSTLTGWLFKTAEKERVYKRPDLKAIYKKKPRVLEMAIAESETNGKPEEQALTAEV